MIKNRLHVGVNAYAGLQGPEITRLPSSLRILPEQSPKNANTPAMDVEDIRSLGDRVAVKMDYWRVGGIPSFVLRS